MEVWPRRPSFFNLILLAPWAPIGAPGVGRSAFWSVRYGGRAGPYFSIYGPWRPGDQSAPRFAESCIYAGAVFCLHRSLFFNLGPPGALAVYRPRFPEGGILVGAAFRPHPLPVISELGHLPLCGSIGPVFRGGVFWSVQYSGSAGPRSFDLVIPRTRGSFGARFPKRGELSGRVGRLPVGGSMPKGFPSGRTFPGRGGHSALRSRAPGVLPAPVSQKGRRFRPGGAFPGRWVDAEKLSGRAGRSRSM